MTACAVASAAGADFDSVAAGAAVGAEGGGVDMGASSVKTMDMGRDGAGTASAAEEGDAGLARLPGALLRSEYS